MTQARIGSPATGIAAMRIAVEFGGPDDFADSFAGALERGGSMGATFVAALDRGDLSIHLPREDGPCWNSVPLFHLHAGEQPSDDDWAATTSILEKLERYR